MFTQKQLKEFIQEEFSEKTFETVANPLQESEAKKKDLYTIYDIKYYVDELHIVENLLAKDGKIEFNLGKNILVEREFIPVTSFTLEDSFSMYTKVKKTAAAEDDSQAEGELQKTAFASIVIVHGNSENSDSFLEVAVHHALNNFEVHIIDLKGQGLAAGEKNGHYKI